MAEIVKRFGVWILVAVVGVFGFVFRDRLTGGAGDLVVGDCFDVPTGMEQEVEDVQHRPCTEPHTGEVFYVGDYTGDGAFPGVPAFDTFTEEQCIPAFEAYTGRDWETDTELSMTTFYPTEDGWNAGDKEISCSLVALEDGAAPFTQSYRAAAGG